MGKNYYFNLGDQHFKFAESSSYAFCIDSDEIVHSDHQNEFVISACPCYEETTW